MKKERMTKSERVLKTIEGISRRNKDGVVFCCIPISLSALMSNIGLFVSVDRYSIQNSVECLRINRDGTLGKKKIEVNILTIMTGEIGRIHNVRLFINGKK